jgi:hypothetical protein
MIGSYPKIHALGHPYIANLFNDDVLCEEKIDGSQFSFGIINGELHCRSKGQQLNVDAPDKMFAAGVETAKLLANELRPDWTYRGEYLQKPKHNALAYDRIPRKHVVIYDIQIGPETYLSPVEKATECDRLELECVPVFHNGTVDSIEAFRELLDRTSMLGGQKIEGIVFKNYHRFGPDGKALMGKYVSDAFKEVHRKEWKKDNPRQADVLTRVGQQYQSKARWNKAIQHMRERGELESTPRDIGKLIKEIQSDVDGECRPEIAEQLLIWAMPHVQRMAIHGFAEWYKQQLAESQFADSRLSDAEVKL